MTGVETGLYFYHIKRYEDKTVSSLVFFIIKKKGKSKRINK